MTILDDARAVLAQEPVCDACLGRCFADRSFGLTNAKRGRALRMACVLDADEPHEPTNTEDCWVCEGECGRFETWAESAVAALEDIEFVTYQVGTRAPPLIEENDRLLRETSGLDPDAGELFKSEFNREVGKRLGERTDTEVDFERPEVLALLDLDRADVGTVSSRAVEVQVNPAFVYGRYRKRERDIPQTEWPCRECGGDGVQLAADGGSEPCEYCGGSGYLYEESVEELTTPPVVEAMAGREAVFHGAGREDVDARMLGTGRPFVIEVKRPRERAIDADDLQESVNEFGAGRVEVEGLRRATHEMVERVKELDAHKTYAMDVEFAEAVADEDLADALAALDGATVEQDTPQRVDHRRASRTRIREVYSAAGELEDDTHASIEVNGAGGLYVKELVGGDEGRTDPSLADELGVGSEVTALDVLAVEGEEEEFGDPDYLVNEES